MRPRIFRQLRSGRGALCPATQLELDPGVEAGLLSILVPWVSIRPLGGEVSRRRKSRVAARRTDPLSRTVPGNVGDECRQAGPSPLGYSLVPAHGLEP